MLAFTLAVVAVGLVVVVSGQGTAIDAAYNYAPSQTARLFTIESALFWIRKVDVRISVATRCYAKAHLMRGRMNSFGGILWESKPTAKQTIRPDAAEDS